MSKFTASDVAAVAAAYAGDPNGDYAKKETFYIPLLQGVQDDLMNSLYQNPNITRLNLPVVIPNIPAGTTDLADYFKDGGPLELMGEIISLREKTAGAPDFRYQRMVEVTDLPIRQQTGYNAVYIWNGSNIFLVGATQALDMRVYGTFDPVQLKNGESPVIPNCKVCLEFGLAAAIAEAHDNENKIPRLNGKYEQSKSQLFTNIMMEMQNEETRQIPYGSPGGTFW